MRQGWESQPIPTLYFWTRSSSGIAVMICSSATLNAQMAATGLIEFAKISGQHQHGTEPVRGIVISMLASTMHACHLLGVTKLSRFFPLLILPQGILRQRSGMNINHMI
jgi:hypothetical protein